jgi:hypothetical protein
MWMFNAAKRPFSSSVASPSPTPRIFAKQSDALRLALVFELCTSLEYHSLPADLTASSVDPMCINVAWRSEKGAFQVQKTRKLQDLCQVAMTNMLLCSSNRE